MNHCSSRSRSPQIMLCMLLVISSQCKYCECTDVCDDKGHSPALDRALRDGLSLDCVDIALYLINRGCGGDEHKVRLLFKACYYGRLDVVKELVEQHKVDPKGKDDISTINRIEITK